MKSDNRGKNYNDVSLEDIIIDRNLEGIIAAIEDLVHRRTSDTQLAYILYGLCKAKLLKDIQFSYAPFHKALQHRFPDEKIGDVGRAQNLYNRLYSGKNNILGKKEEVEYQKWRSIVSSALFDAIQ